MLKCHDVTTAWTPLKWNITTTDRCVTFQKSEDLIYTAAEAWNHGSDSLVFINKRPPLKGRDHFLSTVLSLLELCLTAYFCRSVVTRMVKLNFCACFCSMFISLKLAALVQESKFIDWLIDKLKLNISIYCIHIISVALIRCMFTSCTSVVWDAINVTQYTSTQSFFFILKQGYMFRLKVSHLQTLTTFSLPDALPTLRSHCVYNGGIRLVKT